MMVLIGIFCVLGGFVGAMLALIINDKDGEGENNKKESSNKKVYSGEKDLSAD